MYTHHTNYTKGDLNDKVNVNVKVRISLLSLTGMLELKQ